MARNLILSVFPGIDVFGMGFERQGYCVVKGPDIITGGDVRDFKAVPNAFEGVIGGPPCQGFSGLNRNPSDYSLRMLGEFGRVVREAKPDWFLMENVARVPSIQVEGYQVQRFNLDYAWFSEFSRLRCFQFGSRRGVVLNPMKGTKGRVTQTAITTKESMSFKAMCDVTGLPEDFTLPSFHETGKKRALGNAVPLPMAEYCAGLIKTHTRGTAAHMPSMKLLPRCNCGCGRSVTGRAVYHDTACRVRAYRRRRTSQSQTPSNG